MRVRSFTAIVGFCAAVAGIWFGAHLVAQRDALRDLAGQADQLARQHSRLIDSELARFRLLPIVLAEFGDLRDALTLPSAEQASKIDLKLTFLARETGASILYLVDRTGRVISASNAGTRDSFVGQDFSFRPYITEALAKQSAEYHAVGALTGRPGLFLARSVGDRSVPVGVVVVKFEFAALTKVWAGDPGTTLIVDNDGIIFAASDETDIMTTLKVLPSDDRTRIDLEGRYRKEALLPGRYQLTGAGSIRGPQGDEMLVAELPVAGTPLKLLHLLPLRPALRDALNRTWLTAGPATLLLVLAGSVVWWRMTKTARDAAYRRRLEEEVTQRTEDLRCEMAERVRANQRFRDAREELAQANRLASLGSITAGLMHEINQPVATIRTLAENARHHLSAERMDRVKENLDSTIEVSARIGSIMSEMRNFSRRGHRDIVAESLDTIVSGALLLLGDRFVKGGIELKVPENTDLNVLADRVRLEQVLVNLLQNAIDAVEVSPSPHVLVTVTPEQDCVTMTVADNGPGINPEQEIFRPFVTGKPGGLGLGLGIAQDIMRDLGGSLTTGPSPLGGAAFIVKVRRA